MPRLRIRDIDIYYEITGKGPSLLFLHGLGASARDWESQVTCFSKQYRVVTPDLRGHGRSDKPAGPYSIPMFAAETAELINSLQLGRPHVVGISMGGMVAFELAIQAPHLVRGLVIVNSRPDPKIRTTGERIKANLRFLLIHTIGLSRIAKLQSRRLFPGTQHTKLRRQFIERKGQNDKQAYLASLQAIFNWSAYDRLGAIRCPVLVIAGDKDYRPLSEKRAYVSEIPGAEMVVIAGSHHATPMERPDRFNQVLLHYLSGKVTDES